MIQENMTASHITFSLYRRHNKFAGRLSIVFATLLSFSAFGDQSPTPADTNSPSSAVVTEKTSLGNIADMAIPPGYRFIDRDRSSEYLRQTGNSVPPGLVGNLAHNSADWLAVIEFSDIGYLKEVEKKPIDSAVILQAIRNKVAVDNARAARLGIPPVLSVDWEQAPVFDPTFHSLSWSLRVETPLTRMINHKVVLLGRNGALEVTAVQPAGKVTGLVPLEELVKSIAFKPGLAYHDYREGDTVASLSLLELIVNDQEFTRNQIKAAGSFFGSWIFFALVGCVGVGAAIGCVVFLKRLARREIYTPEHGTQTLGSLIKNGTSNHHSNGHSNGSLGDLGPAESAGRLNGRSARAGAARNGRRRMAFDYSKFYVDFVMSSTNATGSGVINEISPMVSGDAAPMPEAIPNPELRARLGSAAEDLELVERLRTLIEEQKRLIHQQTRLIEEKNKFIEEQNEFLERQSAMVKDQFTLKLE